MKRSLLFALLAFIALFSRCKFDKVPNCVVDYQIYKGKDKVKGLSFDGSIDFTTDTIFNTVVDVNANWVAIIPFGYLNSSNDDFWWGTQGGYWGISDAGIEGLSQYANNRGLKVMIKPQVQIDAGNIFTGQYEKNSEAGWAQLETKYRQFILHYLQVAINTDAEMFCVGTEWKEFATQRPDFWRSLINEVRQQFNGRVLYAANWDEYREIEFWEDLDFIGVDAYFSISSSHTPSVEEIKSGWQNQINILHKFSCDHKRQIIFTEYGYRSTHFCAKDPWDTEYFFGDVNLQGQANAYEGLFQSIWEQDWFAGGFAWKWFAQHYNSGGPNDNRYTPQNKPAQSVIEEYYDKF